jgi:hypothetical protein
VIYAPYI